MNSDGYSNDIFFNEGVAVNKINSIDFSSEIKLDTNLINLVANNVLINGQPIPNLIGFVKNPMLTDLNCGNKNITNLKSLNISSIGFGSAATISGAFTQLTLESFLTASMNRKCNTLNGVKNNQNISVDTVSSLSDDNVSSFVSSIILRATQDHTVLNKGVDYIINSINQNTNSNIERFRIGSDSKTYITGELNTTGNINGINLPQFVGLTEASVTDLDLQIVRIDQIIQNIESTTVANTLSKSSQFKIDTDEVFSITSIGATLQSLYFRVRNTGILSQISHSFSLGLFPVSNLACDIGSYALRFNHLHVDKINDLTSCGGKYNKTGNDITITNTTSKVSMLNSGVGSLLWPANSVKLGDSYHVRVSGTLETDGKSNSILFEIKLDTRIIHSSDFIDLDEIKSSFPFEIEVDFTFYSTNSNADINASSQFVYVKNTGSDDFRGSTSNTQSTINAFRDNTMSATAQWADQSPNNILVIKQFTVSKTY
jgi:hypothetical protein